MQTKNINYYLNIELKTGTKSEQMTSICKDWKHRNKIKIIIFKVDVIVCEVKPEQLQFKANRVGP